MNKPNSNAPAVHLIGNAHLDPVWLWRWQEGCAEAIGTCWAAIDRLDEGEGFIFTKGEAHIYAWIEELDPELFARIKHYVAEMRWVIVNGWWIQPDCNVPSGESVIRQALYGKRYFQEKFGVDVPTGYNVDSFGHPGTFPMLLQHTGTTSYTFMRPGPHEMELPAELFEWGSPDGSSVTAFRIQVAYNTSKREMPLPQKIDLHQDLATQQDHPFMCFYGVGNHGGAPTIENIDEIERRLERGENLKFSDPEAFFDEVDTSRLPRVEGELQFHAVGCYAAASSLKALNRKAESILEQAEAAAALATRELDAPYPRAEFETLWRTLLFNQFHDTLGGTSLESACVDSERELAGVIADADKLLNAAARRLGNSIAPSVVPEDATFLVMNFNGQAYDGLVEAEPWVDKDNLSKRVLLDEDGSRIDFQYADPHGKTTGLQRIVFRLDLPAFGYRALRFSVDETGVAAPAVSFGKNTSAMVFETGGYRMELDRETGGIKSLFNKQSKCETFEDVGHRPIIVEDLTDTWSHGVDRFGMTGRNMTIESVSEIESGAIRKVVKLVARSGDSIVTSLIILPESGELPVEMRVRLQWNEQRKLLRLAYPLAAKNFEYEVPGGWEARADNGREVPGLRWVRAVGADSETILVNNAKYSYSANDGTLYLTAVRSPVFAHHDPIELQDGAHYSFMDQGVQEFSISLLTQPKISRKSAATLADNINKPVITTPHVGRSGNRAHRGQWLDIAAQNSHFTTLKGSEDGNSSVLRAYELDGNADTAVVMGTKIPVVSRGVVTLLIAWDDVRQADGLERPISPQ